MRTSILCLFLGLFTLPINAAEISFQSPSGNIRCLMSDEAGTQARCDLGVTQQTYTDRPASCDGIWGTSFVVGRTGRGDVNCAADELQTNVGFVLPYGASLGFVGILCRSEPFGVICTNGEGGGFTVRRSEQRVF